MFHRVKSESHSAPDADAKAPSQPQQSEKPKATIKPDTSMRMAQSAAVNAAEKAAPKENVPQAEPQETASLARQAYVKKQVELGVAQQREMPKAQMSDKESVQKEEMKKVEPLKTFSRPQTLAVKETKMANPAQTQENKTTSFQSSSNSYSGYAADSENDSRLTIGHGITMSGEIENCEHLLVEGTVEAALRGASVLEISESGTFYGTVEIQEAEIAGRFEGDLTAYDRLIVRSTGVITGTISYNDIEVESGAQIEGRLSALPRDQAAVTKTRSENKTREVRVQDTANLKPANTDDDLFSGKAQSGE